MKEKSLLKLSLVCAIIGLIGLFLTGISRDGIAASDIDLEEVDSFVQMTATVQRITTTNGTTFMTLKSEALTDAVMFKANNVPLRKGDVIEIRGKIDKSKGKTSLIADEVRLVG